MAAKRTRRTVLTAIPKQVGKAQAEAEKVLARGYKATLRALPAGPRRAVKELADQLEDTAGDLSRRGKRTLSAVEKRGATLAARVDEVVTDLGKRRKALLTRVEKIVAGLERRRGQALKAAEKQLRTAVTRIEKRIAGLEKRAVASIRPLVNRLEIATRTDIEELGKRVNQLERKLGRRGKLAA